MTGKTGMARHSMGSFVGLMGVSVGIWLVVGVLCLMVGSMSVGWPGGELLRGRAETVLHASMVGAALAAAGVAYQAVLRNTLADPYLLGIASGATLGSLVWRMPAFALVPVIGALGSQASALVGACVAAGMVFTVAGRRGRLDPVTLLLTGVIVSSLCGAVLLLLVTVFPELLAGEGGGAGFVLVGGLQTSLSPTHKAMAGGVIVAGVVGLVLLSSALGVGALSDVEAESMGVRVNRLRWMVMIVASVVVSASVAVSGPIGFVGLIGPHMARALVGPDPRRHLPVAVAMGAALLAGADGVCRWLSQQGLLGTLLPVGVITALLGGPFFLVLMLRGRGAGSGEGGRHV